jgi:hypothetical protein
MILRVDQISGVPSKPEENPCLVPEKIKARGRQSGDDTRGPTRRAQGLEQHDKSTRILAERIPPFSEKRIHGKLKVKQIQCRVRVALRLGKESRDGGVPIKVINQTKGEIVVDNKQHLGSVTPLHFSESAVKTVPGHSPRIFNQ